MVLCYKIANLSFSLNSNRKETYPWQPQVPFKTLQSVDEFGVNEMYQRLLFSLKLRNL